MHAAEYEVLSSIGRAPGLEVRFELAQVNGEAAIVVTAEGRAVTAIVLEVAEERVEVIRLIANPDKLAGLAVPGSGC